MYIIQYIIMNNCLTDIHNPGMLLSTAPVETNGAWLLWLKKSI